MYIFGIPKVHKVLLCVRFHLAPPFLSLVLVKTCSGGRDLHPPPLLGDDLDVVADDLPVPLGAAERMRIFSSF